MKKFMALITLAVTIAILCGCGAAQTSFTADTTAAITWQHAADATDAEMMFSFNIKSEYTHVIVTVNNGALVSSSDEKAQESQELRLSDGESFYWIPDENSEENTVIVVQVCNMSQTVHCGTISLVSRRMNTEVDRKEVEAVEYSAVLDSDDGMKIRQGHGKESVVIYA